VSFEAHLFIRKQAISNRPIRRDSHSIALATKWFGYRTDDSYLVITDEKIFCWL
jgi:hypothetical protein